MVVRPLDENGDMMPIYDQAQMIDGAPAVAQVVDLRLNLLHGEWWEDEEIGFRIPEFLASNARSGDVSLLAKYVASYISKTSGVLSVTNVESSYFDHVMTFRCTCIMDNGEFTPVEVNLSGIF